MKKSHDLWVPFSERWASERGPPLAQEALVLNEAAETQGERGKGSLKARAPSGDRFRVCLRFILNRLVSTASAKAARAKTASAETHPRSLPPLQPCTLEPGVLSSAHRGARATPQSTAPGEARQHPQVPEGRAGGHGGQLLCLGPESRAATTQVPAQGTSTGASSQTVTGIF